MSQTSRVWRGQLAQLLMERYGTASPEDALLILTRRLLIESDNMDPPVDVKILASCSGAVVEQKNMTSEGELRMGLRNSTIAVKGTDIQRRQRLTVCHEVVHIELAGIVANRPDYAPSDAAREKDEEEELCHLGSAMLLVDPSYLIDHFATRPMDFQAVSEAATLFEASLDIVCQQIARFDVWPVGFIDWRLGPLSDATRRMLAPAALLDDDGGHRWRVRRFFRSRTFPHEIPVGYGGGTRQLERLRGAVGKSSRQERRFALASGRAIVDHEAWYVPYGSGPNREERFLGLLRETAASRSFTSKPRLPQLTVDPH